jgi:hypothetical protein
VIVPLLSRLAKIRSQHKLADQAREISVEQVGLGFADLRMVQPNTRSASLPNNCEGFEVSLVAGGSTQLHGVASDIVLPSLSDLPEFGG